MRRRRLVDALTEARRCVDGGSSMRRLKFDDITLRFEGIPDGEEWQVNSVKVPRYHDGYNEGR